MPTAQRQFIFTSNGHQFVEFDCFSGLTCAPGRLRASLPRPSVVPGMNKGMGFTLESSAARPLLQRYAGGEGARRYYQDAAIRAVMEKIARCKSTRQPKRALLSLATGAGKTFIAVNLLKRISDAGQLTRALFVCDRDELRTQALKAFQNVFGADAAEVYRKPDGTNNAKTPASTSPRTRPSASRTRTATPIFLTTHYPGDFFTHIVIDECHRSASGQVVAGAPRNRSAVQIGLTATPRQLVESLKRQTEESETDSSRKLPLAAETEAIIRPLRPIDPRAPYGVTREVWADAEITANNLAYFDEPTYEYDIAQAIEDGYLAACEIQKDRVNLDDTGITKEEIIARNPVDAITGQPITAEQIEDLYQRTQYGRPHPPARPRPGHVRGSVQLSAGYRRPRAETIIFCARDRHADDVAVCLNNLYAKWCADNGKQRLEYYAFKCTAASSGNDQLPDLRASSRSHFIATTVDLLTTGVDVPCVRNIVFFKYLKSPISFYQMVGRGTRIDAPTGKLMFRVYDYTDATRLFGEGFITKPPRTGGGSEPPPPPLPPESTISVEGFDVRITDAGRFIVADVDGKAMPVPIEEYKARLAAVWSRRSAR